MLEIGKPFQRELQGGFGCLFRIVGLGSLQLALVLVRVRLEGLAGYHQGSIRWLGQEGSWGLPASADAAMGRES